MQIKVKPGSTFSEVIVKLRELPSAPANLKYVNKDSSYCLTSSDIRWCHNQIKDNDLPYHIHQLLCESQLELPSPPPHPPPSEEYKARLDQLRAEQANKEYARMTSNVTRGQFETSSLRGLARDMKEIRGQVHEMNRQLVTGAQYVVSVVGTFFAVFVGLGYGNYEFRFRLLFGMFCAVAVAVAEIYFIIRQDIVEENRRTKQKKNV